MKYLLDTCVLSEFVKPKPNSGLLKWMSEQSDFDFAISPLTLGELRMGMALLPEGKKRTSLELWLLESLQENYGERILSISDEIGLRWGYLNAQAKQKGKSLPAVDSLLLATADIHQLAIVTRNTADFEGFNVKVVNPWN
jgi:toxin FitB